MGGDIQTLFGGAPLNDPGDAEASGLQTWLLPDAGAVELGLLPRAARQGHRWVIIATRGDRASVQVFMLPLTTGTGWRWRVRPEAQHAIRAPVVNLTAAGRPVRLPFQDVPPPPVPVAALRELWQHDTESDLSPDYCRAIHDAIHASPRPAWNAIQRLWTRDAETGRRCPGCDACENRLRAFA